MIDQVQIALAAFTDRYCQLWRQQRNSYPVNRELLGFASPCVIDSDSDQLQWQPQPFTLPANLDAVSRGMEILLQPTVVSFYTSQFAAEMPARFDDQQLTLLQIWNEDDVERIQQNLIGHLLMKQRLKQSPTLFIATSDKDNQLIAVDNLTGQVLLETLGSKKKQVLSDSLAIFLEQLTPVLDY